MTKNLIVRFSVEDKVLPSLLSELLLLGDSHAQIEDFYVPTGSSYFDNFGLAPQKVSRDPKSGSPTND